MNLGINNNYNPAFGAKVKFNYDGGKTQKGTWAEVAKIVEAKTKSDPDGTISIDLDGKDLFESAVINHDRIFQMSEQGAKELDKLTPKQIAQKIVKLFNIAKYEDVMINQYDTFIEKIAKLDSKFKMVDPDFERFEDDIFGPLYEKKSDTVKLTLDQDPVLRYIENK
ncbi:hypothetical protein IKL64_04685 [bacterium]|nr:hypothetical protein [bacterium]